LRDVASATLLQRRRPRVVHILAPGDRRYRLRGRDLDSVAVAPTVAWHIWHIAGGPREVYNVSSLEMDVGWVYTIESGSTSRTITVIVAAGRLGSSELPQESRRAIETHGRSAVEAVRDRETPPLYLLIGTGGIEERRG
jgi:hypothetical protein